VSLFSGAGGLDLGFVQSGRFSLVFANDVLLHMGMTHSKNFKLKLALCGGAERAQARLNTVLVCDISRVDFSALREAGVDLVVGGPPCQDFSIVRGPQEKRRGVEVRRGRLYAHFVRALAILQPKMFVFENVPGLVSANRGLAYKVILEDFSNLRLRWPEVRKVVATNGNGSNLEGYELVFSNIVDFSALGVPQKRERLIIIGVRKDLLSGDPELSWRIKDKIEKALSGRLWLFRKYPLTPIEVFEGRTLTELDDVYKEIMKKWEGVWEEVNTERALRWKREVWDKLSFNIVKDFLLVNGVKGFDEAELEEAMRQHEETLRELGYFGKAIHAIRFPDGTNEIPEEDLSVVERMRRIPPGENHEFVRGTRWEIKGLMSNVYRRAYPLTPAPTVLAYGGGGTHGYHYDRDRATLTLRERARLQTFPDTFVFYGKKAEIRAQIGEAVPPLASKRIAEAVASVLDEIS